MTNKTEEYIKLVAHCENLRGKRIAVIFEGRDSAGKSSTIKYLTRYINPKHYKIYPSFMPSKTLLKSWLSGWAKKMPENNKICFYDRSYYSRALIQPCMGWCTRKQYINFMENVQNWENEQDIIFIKFWLSIGKDKQNKNLTKRKNSKLIYWKYSENDKHALNNFDRMTKYKKQLFDNSENWHIIDFNNRKRGKLEILKIINKTLDNC